MPINLNLSNLDKILKANSTEQSYQRGRNYCEYGYVSHVVNRENLLQAHVEGSQGEDYSVQIDFSPQGVISAFCTCPYDWGGWCKHIIATLCYCQKYPDNIKQRPSLEQLLNPLNPQQLHNLIVELVEEEPHLIENIERFVNHLTPKTKPSTLTPSKIDTQPIRNQVLRIIEDGVEALEEGWTDEDNITYELSSLIRDVENLITEGDVENALRTLEAITETCVENWGSADDYGIDAYDTANNLDEVFAQAFLSTELSDEEKIDWEVKLEFWENEWSVNFSLSLGILAEGWGCLASETRATDIFDDVYELNVEDVPDYARDLTLVRLKVLDSQQRYEDYLYLAKAEGHIKSYLTCLARLGRIETAFSEANKIMGRMEQALALAQILFEFGEGEKALAIAKLGLTKKGECQGELAKLTVELAEQLGDLETVFNAQIKVFEAEPSEQIYLKLEQLAGENWQQLRANLLDYLRTYNGWYRQTEKINIFLYEKLFEEAIKLIEKDSYLLRQDMLAKIIPHDPNWVIQKAITQAESIMDSGKAKYYQQAVGWLTQARNAYYHANNHQGWKNYCQTITKLHGRKYKLMGLLKPILD